MLKLILLVIAFATLSKSLGSDDRFLKKYALIKIFESCFGEDVVKDIRKELKAACMKCQAMDAPTQPSTKPETYPNEKLHQAILAFRPSPYPQPSFRPYPGSAASFYQAFANPAPLFYNPNYLPNPFASSPYGLPFMNQPFFGNSRMSRDMDMKTQWESLMPRLSSRVKNITCVMHELGYIDDNLEPNYAKISERITALPIAQDLRQDIQDGVNYCQQFSQCVPEPKKEASPLSRELTKPMLFFKCYKYKKLEACIMKDIKDKISNISEDDLDSDGELRRAGKSIKLDDPTNELASSMYDFLYGADNSFEMDNMF